MSRSYISSLPFSTISVLWDCFVLRFCEIEREHDSELNGSKQFCTDSALSCILKDTLRQVNLSAK
jgi:hypothetical protein